MSVAARQIQSTDAWLYEQIRFCVDHQLDAVLQVSNDFEYILLGAENLFARRESCLPVAVREKLPVTYRHRTMGDHPELKIWAREHARPVDELLWNCVYGMAEHGLLPGCRRDDVVQLNRWPNLTRLKCGSNGVRIAALLTARPTSLVLASRILDIDEQEVFRFYCACKYAGMIRMVNRADVPSVISGNEHKHLLLIRRLFDRLSHISF
jgi:hypothetical protein